MDKIYYIADPASNHNGSLTMAQRLIHSAAQAGANAIKFQFFTADTLIDQQSFKKLGNVGHQKNWGDVYETYKKYETPLEWIPTLARDCERANIDLMGTPYYKEAVDALDPYVKSYKIGSGDINYYPLIEYVLSKKKLTMFGLGASNAKDVSDIINMLAHDDDTVLMQCNTNYSNSKHNYKYLNLKLLKQLHGYKKGLSDHTKELFTIHVAIAYGARYIERHFKIEDNPDSPDNDFSLDPREFKQMVVSGNKCLESLGDGVKKIEENEKETRIIQRRDPFTWKRPDLSYKE